MIVTAPGVMLASIKLPSLPVTAFPVKEPVISIVAPASGWPLEASVTVPLMMPEVVLVERGTVPRFMIEPAVTVTVDEDDA